MDREGNSAEPGQEGLQYLCTKYSSLITRLREEVVGRQQAQGEARLYERRLREEASMREAERRQWEEERGSLRDEIRALRILQREVDDTRSTEVLQLRQSNATSRKLSARCDHLHEACAEEVQRTQEVMDKAAAGSQVLLRQGEELTKLRREHADCLVHNRSTTDELATCREHLSRWRHAAGDLESRLEVAMGAREEAESRSRHLQEEMRLALRSASAARAREAATAHCAGRGHRELQSREARLSVVRKEGQRFAQRASSAERRLRVAEGYEVAAERLSSENRELHLRLEAESRLLESTRLDMARSEAAEARAAAGAGEYQSELRAKEVIAASARQRVAELEGELIHARAKLDRLEGERSSCNVTMEGLRNELKLLGDDREEMRKARDTAKSELSESRRRVDRGTPQLAECKRKLQHAEEGLSKASSEVADERRARERCHAEAIRASEKLRVARQQIGHLKERVRMLEELELRYPSRLRNFEADPPTSTAPGKPAHTSGAWSMPRPMEAALPLTPSPPSSPRCFSHRSGCVRHDPLASPCLGASATCPADMDVVKDFVAREERRLPVWSHVDGATGEEPRAALRTQSGVCHRAANFGVDDEMAALLAAEPRVLKLPEPLQMVNLDKSNALVEGGG